MATAPGRDVRLDEMKAAAPDQDLRLAGDEGLAQPISFRVDGEALSAYPGDTVAAALYASGIRAWRRARSGEARGLLCGMGVCLDCLVTVDGIPNQRACQVEVRAGMEVRTTSAGQAANQEGENR